MKNRSCKMSKTLLGALFLLGTCAVTYSCSDDYDLDETTPSFLGSSIYEELEANGNYTYTLRLIEDLDYKDVLSRTGSRTLFVTSDEDYDAFFSENTWGVSSYDELSDNQKRYLLYNAMLNNAYVLEMMANCEGDAGDYQCLRQGSSASATDTIRYWKPEELPVSYNEADDEDDSSEADTKYWARFTNGEKNGIYMALDATDPMITHFFSGNLNYNDITTADLAFLLGKDSIPNGYLGYIFNNEIIEGDATCLNGYYHVLDGVLLAPNNMAEEIRSNGNTYVFSHILDRFSAPFYNGTLTENYSALHAGIDSVFEKRYFATRSQGGSRLSTDPDGTSLPGDYPYLNYDPGWNEYAPSSSQEKEEDMAAMFVPSDDALVNYFLTGGGVMLLERYGSDEMQQILNDANQTQDYVNSVLAALPNGNSDATAAAFYKEIDQVPLDLIQSLVNNLMKSSFSESVPSKYLTIMNDARDAMFADYTQEQYQALIDTVILANNGVVYVMNSVMTPADYAAVIAPVLISTDTKVMRAVTTADEDYIQGSDYNNAPLKQYFSTYLKAMQARFSFFVPTDNALGTYGYVDPAGYATGLTAYRRYWKWQYSSFEDPSDGYKRVAVRADAYRFVEGANSYAAPDNDTYLGSTYTSRSSEGWSSATASFHYAKAVMLMDMVNDHIIVHDEEDARIESDGKQYYMARSGAPIKLLADYSDTRDAHGVGMQIVGGWQEYLINTYGNEYCIPTVTMGYDMTGESSSSSSSVGVSGYGNGMTYMIDKPFQPTMKTVYSVLSNESDNSEFFTQCAYYNEDLLIQAGLNGNSVRGDTLDRDDWEVTAKMYRIFTNEDVNPPSGEQLVRFFNNYRYTVYAPTDAAMQAAYGQGLPTWDEIEEFITSNLGVGEEMASYDETTGDTTWRAVTSEELSYKNKMKAQAMITTLVNFLKYHFQDELVFVDNVNASSDYQTSCIDSERNAYIDISVQQVAGGLIGSPGNQIVLTDAAGNTVTIESSNGLDYNVLAHEQDFNASASSTGSIRYIEVDSHVVIHQIPTALIFDSSFEGDYTKAWRSAAAAKKYANKYRILK